MTRRARASAALYTAALLVAALNPRPNGLTLTAVLVGTVAALAATRPARSTR